LKKILKNIFILLLGVICTCGVKAQEFSTDSIQAIIELNIADTQKVAKLNKKGWDLINVGSFDDALLYLARSQKLAETIGYKKGLATAISMRGVAYRMTTEYQKALDCLFRALELNEELGAKGKTGLCLGNIGIIYEEQGNYDQALKYYNKALEIRIESNDSSGMAYSYNDIGILYAIKREPKKALDYFFKSLKLREALGEKNAVAESYSSISEAYLGMLDTSAAKTYVQMAITYFEATGDKENLARCYSNLASMTFKKGKEKEALDLLFKALKISEEIGVKSLIKDNYMMIADIYGRTGDYKKAFAYHQKYSALKDSILNEQVTMQVAQMNAKYQSEKKDKELAQQRSEAEKQQFQRNAFIIGFIIVLFFAAIALRGYQQKKKDNKIIAHQKLVVEQKQREVLDSIKYARRIQNSLLPTEKYLEKTLAKRAKNGA
jgi:tetratricopeptide (TPR) repeat protein